MWCVGKLTAEYRQRMYDLLELYARPYCAQQPVVCLDEKSKQLLAHSRKPLAAKPGAPAKEDYEYSRMGTRNLFVAVEPKGNRRHVEVTARRTKADFVAFVRQLVEGVYAQASQVHLVLDNLNTHFAGSFTEVLGVQHARRVLRRIVFHHTPKHASWLNMAEIEIGIMDRQCTGQRFATQAVLQSEVAAWKHRRNQAGTGIHWTFTRQEADAKLSRHYVL